MTIIFSLVHPLLISLTVDSVVTCSHESESVEYKTGRKAYHLPGLGVVATWGARDGNSISFHLLQQKVDASTHTVDTLAELVYQFLTETYRPHESDLEDVGYHVAGFDASHQPRLYHIYYGLDSPRRPEQLVREYRKCQHHRPGTFLYNGRNDLAEPMIRLYIEQVKAGYPTRFNLGELEDNVLLSDFVVRFAAEITPEVGPPFRTFLITPDNSIGILRNEELKPINRDEVHNVLEQLGYQWTAQ